ncbi:MAG: restriction endonuclease, partial [Alphaproteobacteria bacterium]|nr:restriction endonuclease [Alphaproteobacteria bacterium]
DTLGGSMRNIGGVLAQRKFTRSIISCLNIAGTNYHWTARKNIEWNLGKSSVEDTDIELNLSGISWKNEKGFRTLYFNLTVPSVKNNIDICLFDSSWKSFGIEKIKDPHSYLALGELKGGIDPAGADEHWKTARTALLRIQNGFLQQNPHTFFVGAAIEKKMANEIWSLLKDGTISNAANLTNQLQLTSITNWLCNL